MTPITRLVIKYAAFCAVAMALNLGAQYLVDLAFAPKLWVSMGIGTGVGLVAKYVLDRNYIFEARGASVARDTARFALYTLMGAVTTLVFWATEWGFATMCQQPWAKYLGGAIGLVAGYLLKYQLDCRWVFRTALDVR